MWNPDFPNKVKSVIKTDLFSKFELLFLRNHSVSFTLTFLDDTSRKNISLNIGINLQLVRKSEKFRKNLFSIFWYFHLFSNGFGLFHQDLNRTFYTQRRRFELRIVDFDPYMKTLMWKKFNWCLQYWFISILKNKIFKKYILVWSLKVKMNPLHLQRPVCWSNCLFKYFQQVSMSLSNPEVQLILTRR